MKIIYGLSLLLVPVLSFSQVNTEKSKENPAQDNVALSGHITDEKTKLPLAGATIHIKGTTHELQTDAKGAFRFVTGQKIPVVFIVTYVGYETAETTINQYNNITVSLHEASSQLNDVVVVGYGTQKKADVTGAISSVSEAQLKEQPVTNLQGALEGKTAGVQIIQNSGAPGASAPCRQGDVPVAQLLLEHRDRRPGIALLALGDRDGGRDADRVAAHGPPAVVPEFLEEQLAILLLVHGRRLGVAGRSEAETNDQRGDRGSQK